MSSAALATAPHADTRLQRRDSSDIPRPPSTSADAARPAVEHVLLPLVAGDELESGCSLGAEAALRDRRVGIPSMSMIFTFRRTSMTGGPPVGRQWAKTRRGAWIRRMLLCIQPSHGRRLPIAVHEVIRCEAWLRQYQSSSFPPSSSPPLPRGPTQTKLEAEFGSPPSTARRWPRDRAQLDPTSPTGHFYLLETGHFYLGLTLASS
jgi:hypothetical protein